MHQSNVVRRLQATGCLETEVQRLLDRDHASHRQNVGQQLAGELLHDRIGEPVRGLAELIDCRNVRVFDLGRLPQFLLQVQETDRIVSRRIIPPAPQNEDNDLQSRGISPPVECSFG